MVGAVEAGAIKTASNVFVGVHEVLPWGALLMSKVCLMSSYRTLTAPYCHPVVVSRFSSVALFVYSWNRDLAGAINFFCESKMKVSSRFEAYCVIQCDIGLEHAKHANGYLMVGRSRWCFA